MVSYTGRQDLREHSDKVLILIVMDNGLLQGEVYLGFTLAIKGS